MVDDGVSDWFCIGDNDEWIRGVWWLYCKYIHLRWGIHVCVRNQDGPSRDVLRWRLHLPVQWVYKNVSLSRHRRNRAVRRRYGHFTAEIWVAKQQLIAILVCMRRFQVPWWHIRRVTLFVSMASSFCNEPNMLWSDPIDSASPNQSCRGQKNLDIIFHLRIIREAIWTHKVFHLRSHLNPTQRIVFRKKYKWLGSSLSKCCSPIEPSNGSRDFEFITHTIWGRLPVVLVFLIWVSRWLLSVVMFVAFCQAWRCG